MAYACEFVDCIVYVAYLVGVMKVVRNNLDVEVGDLIREGEELTRLDISSFDEKKVVSYLEKVDSAVVGFDAQIGEDLFLIPWTVCEFADEIIKNDRFKSAIDDYAWNIGLISMLGEDFTHYAIPIKCSDVREELKAANRDAVRKMESIVESGDDVHEKMITIFKRMNGL